MRQVLFIALLFPVLAFSQGRFPFPNTAHLGAVAPANMVSNGTFDNTDDWTTSSEWTIAGGVATYTDGVANTNMVQAAVDMVEDMVASTAYTIEFDITIVSGNAVIRFYTADISATLIAEDSYADGHHSKGFTTGLGSEFGIAIQGRFASDNDFSIDNIVLTAD
jgi:hypothetical protein